MAVIFSYFLIPMLEIQLEKIVFSSIWNIETVC